MLHALILASALATQDAPASTPASSAPTQAVNVDDYKRNYEGAETDSEARFDSGIWSAYNARENAAGPMEGSWVVADDTGHQLVGFELRSDNGGLDGAWRSLSASAGLNGSGFVSDIELIGRDMEVNYFADGQRSPTIIRLHRDNSGQWRGSLMDVAGGKTPVVMSRMASGG